jgi:predicted exporter/SAM-dependent methyltransferase
VDNVKRTNISIQYRLLIIALLFCCGLAGIGLLRLQIDTDVIRSLPAENSVLSDALDIFANHPLLEQIAVDVRINRDDPDTLVACGTFVEKELRSNTLFTQVGTEQIGALLPGLALHLAENLPLLFTADELQEQVAPKLSPSAVQEQIQAIYTSMSSMDGIGQAGFVDIDPLGLKDLVLARMAMLAPSLSTRFYQGMLLSADNRHLLVTARPAGAGTDTGSARRIAALLTEIGSRLTQKYGTDGLEITLTPVGAFRAALDNETIIRRDVRMALILAMAGISLLLVIAFPRPFIGLLSLVPALAGTAVALFVYSLFHSSISIMVLGFGGAVISITVDHGIAYLLFLDRPHATRGGEAAAEVRAVGLLAVCTTIGAFAALCFSGFPMFVELGQFTALGVLFSFLFVHLVFPRVFPSLPAGSSRSLPLQKLVDRCAATGWPGFTAAVLLALGLGFFGSPSFDVSLESMNTVSRETEASDALFAKTWGGMDNRVFLMISGPDIQDILQTDDQLQPELARDLESGVLQGAFVSSMLFPGAQTAAANLRAWKEFWSRERAAGLQKNLKQAALPLGFSDQAFDRFFSFLRPEFQADSVGISEQEKYFPLLGIAARHGQPGFVQFVTLQPGPNYDPAALYTRYKKFGKMYDGKYFSKQLGSLLFSTFARLLLIIGASITVMLLLFYLSVRLTLLTLLPVGFAYICTLGTLNVLGRSLDIPSLMLSIVILGMGIDYSIFFVRAHQRYRVPTHPSFSLVRMAVFMAAASTLIGFGVLAGAEHSLLRSIGITCLLGVGYSLLGAFLLLPPLLAKIFAEQKPCTAEDIEVRVRHRFRLLEPYPRMFARCKLHYDPMFAELPEKLPPPAQVRTILDIGCGFGVPAAWCLEYFPQAEVTGLDPDGERVRVAGLVIGNRGRAMQGWAAELPQDVQPADLILLLDMLHYINDKDADTLFQSCAQAAQPGAVLILRYTVRPRGKPSRLWHLEQLRIRLSGMSGHYRRPEQVETMLTRAGFTVKLNTVTPTNPELYWLKAQIPKK